MVQKAENVGDVISTTFGIKVIDNLSEDKLRIARVYRFSSQLNFSIEDKTLKACRTYFNDMITQVSGERIRVEMEKMCVMIIK